MNYYERHLGDYARDTGHLSMLEHGAYSLLMDRYYATEQGIPADQAHRLARARSEEERAAVDAVLSEFFVLDAGAWRHKRIDREIAKFKDGEPERQLKRSHETARLKRHREERAALFKALADVGKHVPWNTGIEELRRLVATAAPPLPATAPETPATATRHQTPDTSIKTSVAKATGADAPTPADTIFALGLPLLMAAGVPEKNCRSMLGLMRKTHGDSAVIDALGRCAEQRPLQPVAWLQQVLKAPISKPDRVAHSNIAVVRQFSERKSGG